MGNIRPYKFKNYTYSRPLEIDEDSLESWQVNMLDDATYLNSCIVNAKQRLDSLLAEDVDIYQEVPLLRQQIVFMEQYQRALEQRMHKRIFWIIPGVDS